MTAVLAAIAVFLAGGVLSALADAPLARWVSLAALVGAALLGLPPALQALSGAVQELSLPWSLPGAVFHIGLDPLSACFLILVILVSVSAGVFGEGYLEASHGHLPAGPSRFFFMLLAASMALLVSSRNAVLFMIAWESMALAAFLLVSVEHSKPQVRRAALVYLLCSHTGSLCLLALFALLGRNAGSLEFDAFRTAAALPPAQHHAALALAVVGFGMKAGFVPLHLWLQEAHPAAPSHASAAMSGVMIEMGIYGLLRLFSFLAPVPLSWGVAFIVMGTMTALYGVLFAMVQRDLKRLLAYSSIENIGIILIGLGLGYQGLANQNQALALLGFTGAILHTLNHGAFKSLLFLSAGAVYQALGTRDLEAGGGLLKSMRWTGLATWIGAAAICGLPPLNGFTGEWLIYSCLLSPEIGRDVRLTALAACLLALVGALAVVAFTKAYGTLFLGVPRTEAARAARDPSVLMLGPMALLAAACAALGLFPGPALGVAMGAASIAAGADGAASGAALQQWASLLATVSALGGAFLALCALLWLYRRVLLSGRRVEAGPTWGCGFTAATSRMQYSASSFCVPAALTFSGVLKTREESHGPAGYWPKEASFRSETADPALDRWLPPLAARVDEWVKPLRGLQHGRLQPYLLYVSAFLVVILLWKL